VQAVAEQDASTSLDPVLALGEFAALLADGSALPKALESLRTRTGAEGVVLRDSTGAVLAGDPVLAGPVVELPVHGRSGTRVATLSVSGSRAADLPVLRSAAAVLGLALVPAEDLLEDDRDALADALHDGPVQALVVARYASDAAVRGGDAAVARDAVQSALVDARRFLWHLRPRGATGLVEALDQLSSHLVEAGGPAVGVLGDVEVAAALRGAPAVLAYRLVQALARPDGPGVRVALKAEGSSLVVDVDGGTPLTDPDRWERRARTLGGRLTTSSSRTRLVLPRPETRPS
jgi:signal transduction histidine kinase